ncbi:NahK/ErcS family hybrid sensor histidine kinase/response regulator [Marinobacter sp. HL-58]|uniref:PAS domain-containing hybrid sensor histidine kinase/response regulator n=1 Tax=Marinobacter sp. HL-58 TaxID=1479237 RepID=UPI00048759C6|nr:NahK/ErcS family hybrid sensor histidine kinase/response regulator [Marinobacter sp. HL-58]KPQ03045.1 MAG: PAS domain S-box [Marinobacter sp. HL-58]
MKKPSDSRDADYDIGDLLGLGSQSVRKNYYPALQERIDQLEAERNRYKWLFENALHGIFQANLRGGFVAANPAMARICGYESPEAMMTKVIRLREQLFCNSGEFDAIRQELLDEGSLSAREARLRRADNTPVYVAITLLRRPDLGPEVVEAFVADITERYQAREKLRQLNADLERRVEERTDELQNANVVLRYQIEQREKVERELVVAVDAAREANESKDKYLAAASHDLLQPLNAARLLVSALMDSNLPADENRLVERVKRSLDSAEDLLADLLDISKLEQKAMQPDFVHTDIGELMRGLAQEFEPLAENAELNFRLRAGTGTVRTDPRMLTRILRNLLSNAFRYTRDGGILFAARKRGPNLEIGVWDTGIGIEQDKLQDIFREFHQILPKGGGGRQGVGLGLAIVDRMARVLGYDIRVDSNFGRGSCFSVLMPLDTVTEAPAGRPIRDVPAPASSSFDGLRVLVVDNEEPVQESMKALLERWGCRVVTAGSASEAIERCRITDIILADFHLDGNRTGCEAIHALRRHFDRDIPAAVITADRSDTTRRFISAQYLPILNKPVKPNRLRALVTSLSASVNPVTE